MKVLSVTMFAATVLATTTAQAGELRGTTQLVDTRRLELMNAMTGSQPTQCVIENGFDFDGNNFDNKPSPTAEGCCAICANSAACNMFTWSNHNGGTCWLKTNTFGIIVNPNTKSAVVRFAPPVALCNDVMDNTDLPGGDLANVPSADHTGCCDKCRNTLGCRAYSWSDYNGGTCWLKNNDWHFRHYSEGVKSAYVYPPSEERCTLEQDVDFRGNDIGSAPGAQPSDCSVKCALKSGCKAFTWTNFNGGTCWLKSSQGPCDGSTHVKLAGAVSSACIRECDAKQN